jgi:hypothetical protein
MGYKYETQKDRSSFLPHRNFRRFSRQSSGEELQNRRRPRFAVAAEITKSRSLYAMASPECHPTGDRFATFTQQPIRRNAHVRLHSLHKPAVERIHA